VLCDDSSAGDVRGALDSRVIWIQRGCNCLWQFGMRASVYLEPAAEAVCRNGSTAADCPKSPCLIFPPQSCNTMHCRYIRKELGKFTVHSFSANFQ